MKTNNKKGVRDMRTVYRRRRIGAAIVALGLIFGVVKATVFVFTDKPLDCGIPFIQAKRGDNFWRIAERHCTEEQHRLGEVVYWMMDANLDSRITAGEWIALPSGQDD